MRCCGLRLIFLNTQAQGSTTSCGIAFAAHGSSHGSLSIRTTLPRIAPPRCPAPVFLGEYHYHRPVLGLPDRCPDAASHVGYMERRLVCACLPSQAAFSVFRSGEVGRSWSAPPGNLVRRSRRSTRTTLWLSYLMPDMTDARFSVFFKVRR